MTPDNVLPSMDFWIGTYSGNSTRGVLPLGFDSAAGTWRLGPPEVMIENASFAAFNPRTRTYYMVDEQDDGRIGTWWRSPMGAWRRLGMASSHGAAPCFLALGPGYDRLAVANYASGSVALFPLDSKSGHVLNEPEVFQNSGRGRDASRQNGPHAHCVRFAYDFLFSTDLGTDEVLAWPQSGGFGSLGEPIVAFTAPAGEGPRHILFSRSARVAYLLTELGSKLFVLDLAPSGELLLRDTISTLPPDFAGESLGGHLEINAAGTRLYVSNRGHDSLAVYDIGEDGGLRPAGLNPTFGQSPRHFILSEDDRAILIAHQNGNTVDVVALDADGIPGRHITQFSVEGAAFIGRSEPVQDERGSGSEHDAHRTVEMNTRAR